MHLPNLLSSLRAEAFEVVVVVFGELRDRVSLQAPD
jgi:hypothetical protein